VGEKTVTRQAFVFSLALSFAAGAVCFSLYDRWTQPASGRRAYPVAFSSPAPAARAVGPTEPPVVEAREVQQLRDLAGAQARVRGRIYRVGHSARSNTYFLNFGPSRQAFTAVIFASAVERFSKLHPKKLEGREVEFTGEIKDHPKYGLEMVLEDPSQIRLLD
jgi:hypothetical protein